MLVNELYSSQMQLCTGPDHHLELTVVVYVLSIVLLDIVKINSSITLRTAA